MPAPTPLQNELTRAKSALASIKATIKTRRELLAAAETENEKEAHQKHLNDYLRDEAELAARVPSLEDKIAAAAKTSRETPSK